MANYDVVQIDSLEYDTVAASSPSIVYIDETHYAIASSGGGLKLRIMEYDANYDNIAETTYLLVHSWASGSVSMDKMSDGRLCLACKGQLTGMAYVVEYNVSTYALTLKHSVQTGVTAGTGDYNSIIGLDSTHFILACGRSSSSQGRLLTYLYTPATSTISGIDSLALYTSAADYVSLIQMDDYKFIASFSGVGDSNYAIFKSISCDSSYDTLAVEDSLTITTAYKYQSAVKIDDTHFGCALQYTLYGFGHFRTLSFNPSTYAMASIDNHEFESSDDWYNSVALLDSNHVAIAFSDTGTSYSGRITVVEWDASYDNIANTSTMEFQSSYVSYSSLIYIEDGYLVLAYSGYSSDGFTKTFTIEIPAGGTSNWFFFI